LLEGRAWRDYGHTEKAQAFYAGLDDAKSAADIDPRLFVLLLFSRCALAWDLGRFDEAVRELDGAQSAMEARGLEGADLRFLSAQTAAGLLLARGDVNAARGWIERYSSVHGGNPSEPWMLALAAEIALAEGDLADAERGADAALRAVESASAFRRAPWLRMRVLRVRAGIHLRQGHAHEALRCLEQAHAQSDRVHDPARHVDAAAIRVQLGVSALQLGDVSRARAEASAAAAIYATHPALAAGAEERLRQLWMQLEIASCGQTGSASCISS
jgi:tetratricopeptide (TPR) repeat protein